MSILSRLTNAARALLVEPRVKDHADVINDLIDQRDAATAETRRYALHLDDIRCDLADAGVPIPTDDDPELTPRRMVRALIARLAPVVKEAAVVPEARRVAILRAVAAYAGVYRTGPPAAGLGRYLHGNDDAFDGIGAESIAEHARRLVTEGYLSSTGIRGGPLSLTEKGRAELAVACAS